LSSDAKNLRKLFLSETNLKDTGVNIPRDKITPNFVRGLLKERMDQYGREKPSFLVYAISDASKNIFGTIGIGDINYKDKSAKMGYWISKKNSGKKYCTSAIRLFMERIPRLFDLDRILVEVSQENIASYKVLEKNGFKIIKKSKEKFLLERETQS